MTDTNEKTQSKHSRGRRLLYGLVKLILLVLVLYFVGTALVKQFREVSWSRTHFDWRWLVLGVSSLICGRFIVSVVYKILLRHFGSFIPIGGAMATVWLPQMGKYIPGKVASLVGAVWVMGRYGVPAARGAKTALVIVALSTILGMTMAVPLTLWWEPLRVGLPLAWLWCALFATTGLIALHPRVLNIILHAPMRRMGLDIGDRPLRMRDYGVPAIFLVLNWSFMGTGCWMITRSLAPVGPEYIPVFISAMGLAVSVGFLAFFAPSGLGVRELILLPVLTPLVDNYAAVAIVSIRLLQCVLDLVFAGASLLILQRAPAQSVLETIPD